MNREALRELVRGQVAASRREQGLPENVIEGRFLGQLAAEVIDQEADVIPFPTRADGGGDHGEAA